MLTELGKFLRKYRIDNGLLLKDMADKLEVSPSFVSAIENGKKKIPENWHDDVPRLLAFDKQTLREFRKISNEELTQVSIQLENVSEDHRDLALAFARSFTGLDEREIQRLQRFFREKKY